MDSPLECHVCSLCCVTFTLQGLATFVHLSHPSWVAFLKRVSVERVSAQTNLSECLSKVRRVKQELACAGLCEIKKDL